MIHEAPRAWIRGVPAQQSNTRVARRRPSIRASAGGAPLASRHAASDRAAHARARPAPCGAGRDCAPCGQHGRAERIGRATDRPSRRTQRTQQVTVEWLDARHRLAQRLDAHALAAGCPPAAIEQQHYVRAARVLQRHAARGHTGTCVARQCEIPEFLHACDLPVEAGGLWPCARAASRLKRAAAVPIFTADDSRVL